MFDHIHSNGWDQSYTKWYNHGEPDTRTLVPNTNHPETSDMADFLHDMYPNEPTQENIGETSNEPTQATTLPQRNEFEALLATANETLKFLRECFPPVLGYKIPPSYYEIKKTYKTIGLGYESIHACVNDCFLYWGWVTKICRIVPSAMLVDGKTRTH